MQGPFEAFFHKRKCLAISYGRLNEQNEFIFTEFEVARKLRVLTGLEFDIVKRIIIEPAIKYDHSDNTDRNLEFHYESDPNTLFLQKKSKPNGSAFDLYQFLLS